MSEMHPAKLRAEDIWDVIQLRLDTEEILSLIICLGMAGVSPTGLSSVLYLHLLLKEWKTVEKTLSFDFSSAGDIHRPGL